MQIDLPSSFPKSLYENFFEVGKLTLREKPVREEYVEFCSALNGAAWRYRSFVEVAERYKRIYQDRTSIESIFQTEKALFEFTVNAVSSIECLTYSIWSLLSSPQTFDLGFSESEKRRCGPTSLANKLEDAEIAPELADQLKSISDAKQWNDCTILRNRMFHRSTIPRRTWIGPSGISVSLMDTSSSHALMVDDHYVEKCTDWITSTFTRCCEAAYLLVRPIG